MTNTNFPNHWITAELVGAPPYLQRAAKDYAEAYALAALAQSGEPEAQPARVVDALRERLAQETGDDDDFASGLRSGLRIALDLLSTPTAAPTPSQAAVTELENGDWYWVRYEGLDKTYEAPALFNAAAEAFYSHEFSGIPVREVLIIGRCDQPIAAFEAKKAGA